MGRKCDYQVSGVVLHSFHVQLPPVNLVSSFNWEVWPKVKLSSLIWPKVGHIRENRAQTGRKRGSQEPMFKYYQLTLSLVLFGKFDQKSNFSPDWSELGLIGDE